ncbi:MAG: hypothetical protein IPJ75_01695 [Ignavibacteriales bacterium]|nr:hypothetical protein [Ignavibacteriales bacterium]
MKNRRFLPPKKRENDTRRVGIVNLIKTLISEARFFFNGREITNQTADFHYRLKEASQILIDDSYIYLNKLTKVPKKEDIINLLRNHVTEQFIAEFGGFDDVENELLMHIAKGGNSGVKVDLRSTIDFFKRIPYGYMDDLIIPHALVNLFINGKVTIYYNVTEMTANDIQKRIDNSKEYASIVVKTNEDISRSSSRKQNAFTSNGLANKVQATDTKLVIQEMKESLGKESKELKNLSFPGKDYPFLQRIKHTIERMERALLFESKKFYEYIIEILLPDGGEGGARPYSPFHERTQQKALRQYKGFSSGKSCRS